MILNHETGSSLLNGLGSLNSLNLDENFFPDLHNFQGIFSLLVHLERLDLTHCRINILHSDTFSSLQLLHFLNLKNNHVTFVHHGAFLQLYRLQTLLLQYNQIDSFPKSLLENTHNLTHYVHTGKSDFDYTSRHNPAQ